MLKKVLITLGVFFSTSSIAQDNMARSGFSRDLTAPSSVIESSIIGFEGFEDVTNLTGWIIDNQSNPVGSNDIFQGNNLVFLSQEGGDTEYMGFNFNSTTDGTICTWVIMPDLGYLQNISFWTRTVTNSQYPDRLKVLHSPTGGTTTGTCDGSFGDFTTSLIDINPTLSTGAYPESWTQYTTNIDMTGRTAFVYYVTNAGPNGLNSNYIGIDSLNWVSGYPDADLGISITNNSMSTALNRLDIGDSVTFTITAVNNGRGNATNTIVTSTIPSSLNYVSNTCSATLTGQTLTWNIGDFLLNESQTCSVITTVNGHDTIDYLASISSDETDDILINNTAVSRIIGPVRIIPMLSSYALILLLLSIVFIVKRKLGAYTKVENPIGKY